jgi:hypothetical protein
VIRKVGETNMKKTLLLVSMTALLVSRAGLALAQAVDDVVEKHLTAVGGREALGKLTSRTMSGSITLSTPGGDVTGTIEVYAKAPNKSRSVINVDLSALGAGKVLQDQRFDGTTAYAIDTLNGNREITGINWSSCAARDSRHRCSSTGTPEPKWN